MAVFGALNFAGQTVVKSFLEKPKGDGAWVNAGFFVCEPQIFDYIEGDSTVWEQYPLETLAAEGQLEAFKHDGFWKPMDTLRDKVDWNRLGIVALLIGKYGKHVSKTYGCLSG